MTGPTDEVPPIFDLYRVESSTHSWHFLFNPAAGRGKAQRKWERWLPVLRLSFPDMTWEASTSEHGMARLAEEAVRAGRTHLVGVGGDGTHHDILNGIIAAGKLRDVVYAPLPLGSGNDWVRTLGTPRRPEDWIRSLRTGKTMQHAVGQLQYYSPPDVPKTGDLRGDDPPHLPKRPSGPATRYFINVAGLAYDAEVVRHAEAVWYKHRMLYPLMTLAFLRHFTAPTVRIDYNGESWTGPVHTVKGGCGWSPTPIRPGALWRLRLRNVCHCGKSSRNRGGSIRARSDGLKGLRWPTLSR